MGKCGIKIQNFSIVAELTSNFVDDPLLTYGQHSFIPGALDGLEKGDELVILPPDVDSVIDEEEFDENEIGPLQIPNDVDGRIKFIRNTSSR